MTDPIRVARGLWRPAADVADHGGRCAALLSVLAEGSVVAGVSAARVHELWLPSCTFARPPEIALRRHAATPRAHAHCDRAEVRGRRRLIDERDVVTVGALPVLSIARTWVQLAELLTDVDLIAAGDSAIRAGVRPDELTVAVAASGRQRGVVRARRCLPLLDGRSRSRMESLLRAGLALRGLPPDLVNEPVHDEHGQWLGEPDLGYRESRLALEYNGADHAEIGRMRRDISREFDLLTRGDWHVMTVGPTQVFRQMDQVAAGVRDLIVARLPGSSGGLRR